MNIYLNCTKSHAVIQIIRAILRIYTRASRHDLGV